MNLQTGWVELTVDGSPMEAYVARPAGEGAWPGVLVLMEIFGVNSHIQSVTERIAEQGYVAMAINYYHRTTHNLNLGYDSRSVVEGRKHKEQTTRDGILADVRASLGYLNTRPEVLPKNRFATAGFCFGGHVAYIAAVLPEVAATVSFYGGGIATAPPGGGAPTVTHTPEIQGEVLCLFGEQDPLIPIADMETVAQALSQAGVAHRVIRYPRAGHGFFCDQRADYHPEAAADAWEQLTGLLAKTLKAPTPAGYQ